MLTLLGSDNAIHTLKPDDYYVRYLASGLDEVVFNISVDDPDYIYIQEESEVRDRNLNTYLVKQIDAGKDTAKIICQININDWKAQLLQSYSSGSATPYNTIDGVKPSGWTVIDQSSVTTRRTIPESTSAQPYNVTPWEVVTEVCETWGLRARIDTAAKTLTIINPASYEPLGAFASDELNLKKLQYKGKSTSFATRLYAQGKDGLTFASINDGKAYVDDNTYSNAIVCSWWKDERYTDAQSLLTDARKRLHKLAIPEQSYSCEVYDLAKTNPEMYGIQDFSLFAVINLLDHTKRRAVEHQVVEKWEYPHYPEKNKVTLATVLPSIQNQIVQVQQSVSSPVSTFQQIMNAFVDSQTEKIIGQVGGNLVINDANGDGKPDEILFLDTDDIATATEVWRWNLAGLGHSSTGYNGPYTLAITADGKINADFLMTGTLNAALVNVINLVATKVQAYNGSTTQLLEIMSGYMDLRALVDGVWRQRVGVYLATGSNGIIRVSNGLVDENGNPEGTSQRSLLAPTSLRVGVDENDSAKFEVSSSGAVTSSNGTNKSILAPTYFAAVRDSSNVSSLYVDASNANFRMPINELYEGDGIIISHGKASTRAAIVVKRTDTNKSIALAVGSGGTNRGLYSDELGAWLIYTDGARVHGYGPHDFGTGIIDTDSGIFTITNATGYNSYLIIADVVSGQARMTINIPYAAITTSDVSYQVADESNFLTFKIRKSGTSIVITIGNKSSTGRILAVYGYSL